MLKDVHDMLKAYHAQGGTAMQARKGAPKRPTRGRGLFVGEEPFPVETSVPPVLSLGVVVVPSGGADCARSHRAQRRVPCGG